MEMRIRSIPDEVHRLLKSRASLEGKSLNDYILEILKREAEREEKERKKK